MQTAGTGTMTNATNTEIEMITATIEQEIRDAYRALGNELATVTSFSNGNNWDANSQYGYCLSTHPTKQEAETAAITYYSERMNLIRQ